MKRQLLLLLLASLAACGLHAALVVNEVCYDNSNLEDENGDKTSDWIELYNSGPVDVNISGYGLADSYSSTPPYYNENDGVRLPNYTIPVGGYLTVFASSDLPEYTVWTNAPDVAVIPENSTWRYWHESTAPVGSWTAQSYSDTTWDEGISPLGYDAPRADMDCATLIGDTSVPSTLHTTAYFRKKFTVLKPSVVTGLVMRARIKDGMVVYLNGTEVLRQNMPILPVSYATLASTPVSSSSWSIHSLNTSLLVQGQNTLSIEVHKASSTGTALIMDASLTALINEQVPIVHGQFGLKKTGEKVHLFNASLIRIDECEDPGYEIGENKSWGTIVDGNTSTFQIYEEPTPSLSNAAFTQKYRETLTTQVPVFSVSPGFYASSQSVTLSSPTPGYRIFYTLDGSDPRASATFLWSGTSLSISEPADATDGLAWRRTNPIETESSVTGAGWLPPVGSIDKAVVLRAITVSSDNRYCSPEKSGTYFIGSAYQNRTLPVCALITNEENLFGFVEGLYLPGKYYADSPETYGSNKWGKPYANYHQENDNEEWEHPIHIELFEAAQSTAAVSAGMGFAMHGGGTRALPQKALYMINRFSEYGTDYINYPIFPDLSLTRYKRFLLRSSGNDWYGATSSGVSTMIRDLAMHEIASSLNAPVMAGRPSLVYINGEYWGIHNLRESFDKHYFGEHYNLDPDNIDIISHQEQDDGNIEVVSIDGDKSADNEYQVMLEWIDANPLSNDANLAQITNQIDLVNYTDYIIAETFFGNTDWPQNNCDLWRAHSNQVDTAGQYGDTRWRWMLYDMDVAGEEGAAFNMFDYLTDNSMTAVDEAGFLINELWFNMNYRNSFVSRYADLLNSTFAPSHTSNTIAAAAQKIENEIETHYRRWGRGTTRSQWENAVDTALRAYLGDRHAYSFTHLNSHFGLGGTGLLTVRNNDPSGAGGHLEVNSLKILASTDGVDDPADWTGTYFRSLPVTVRAVPAPGYAFDGWVGSTVTSATRSVFAGASPMTLIARFRPTGSPPYIAEGYDSWLLDNYSEQQIIAGTVTAPNAPSGEAGMSNFELYAFGMHINDGLSDAQRIARASLSVHTGDGGLYAGYNRLNDSHSDVAYTLKAADTLADPIIWRTAIPGQDYLDDAVTNVLDASTWFYRQKLNPSGKPALFLKLDVQQQ